MKMNLALVLAISFLALPAEAKRTSYWTLKVQTNASPSYYAFKSQAACEAQKRRILAGMKRIAVKAGSQGGSAFDVEAVCFNHIPNGYLRPRS